MLRIHNTATRSKEDFNPLKEGRVGLYACGVTVYDHCHIGHARSMVVFDAIVRYLEYSGFEVTYVRNFTDIDDKIIARANEKGVDASDIAARYIDSFTRDMAALGLRPADVEPRATEHIPEIVAAVAELVEKGAAYESGGDVYFSVPDFPPYGSFSGRNLDDLRAGARVAVGEAKKNPLDFALWKASKPGEPTWESPWGPGRPGWHIECSVMAAKYLGQPFDIHGGGEDLVFPHHENEKAQAEALTGRPFVRYWVHNGFVRAGAEKMSKSLGNFLTIQEIIKRYHPQALRLFLLSAHYRSPLDYTEEAMAEADEGINRLYEAWSSAMMGRVQHEPSEEGPLKKAANEARSGFNEAMDNDFNTAQALGHLFFLARNINRSLDKNEDIGGLSAASETLEGLSKVLGLLTLPYDDFRDERQNLLLDRDDLEAVSIQSLIDARTEARKNKDFTEADRLRDELDAQGVMLFDSPEGTTWRLKG